MTDLLLVERLSAEFRNRGRVVRAVNDVSLRIGSGQIVGVVGESGCGKSATVRAILGLIRPPGYVVGGRVFLGGKEISGMRRRELRHILGAEVGFVGQTPFAALNPVLTVEKQFANVIRAHRKAGNTEIRVLALRKLREMGIAGPERVLSGFGHELSGGMAQRVVIGLATVLEPQLVIADEPTTALDITVQRQILDLMRDVVQNQQRSMILVTHDLGVVAHYCDSVAVMYAGRVVESGTMRRVLKSPAHPYTAALLAAVPRPGRPLEGLRGTVPTLTDERPGCAYADRCDFATQECRTITPVLREIHGHEVSCHWPRTTTRPEATGALGGET